MRSMILDIGLGLGELALPSSLDILDQRPASGGEPADGIY